MPFLTRKLTLAPLSQLARYLPKLRINSALNPHYVPSLHQAYHGEWNFNLNWKPAQYPQCSISYVAAIFQAQKELSHAVMPIPTLVMYSDRSTDPKYFNQEAQHTDIILDVKSMHHIAAQLQGNVSVITINSAMHDLVLSKAPVRQQVYQQLFQWLQQQNI